MELDKMVSDNYNEFLTNLKKLSKKYSTNVTNDECVEVISKCYIKLYDKIEKGDKPANLKHYFGMMTYNCFIDTLKQRNKKPPLVQESINEPIDELAHQELILDVLTNLNKLLTPEQFSIYIMKTLNSKNCQEISIELKKPYRYTTGQLKQAKEIIKQNFGDRWKELKYEQKN